LLTIPTVIWTFLPSNVAGRTKKTVTATILFIAYCVGNAIGAQMFIPSDAPKYVKGITACAVLYIMEFCAMGAWRFYCETLPAQHLLDAIDNLLTLSQTSGRTVVVPSSSPSRGSMPTRRSVLARSTPRLI
jgi:hypothetical protein